MRRWILCMMLILTGLSLAACGEGGLFGGLDGVTNEYGDIFMTSATYEIAIGESGMGKLESSVEANNWTFEGEAGQTVSIEVVGAVDIDQTADPRVQLFDPSDEQLGEATDISVFDQNAILTQTLPVDGTYTIRVTMETLVGGYTITLTETE